MNRNNWIGAAIVGALMLAAVLFNLLKGGNGDRSPGAEKQATTFTGWIGGEKSGFLNDEQVKSILARRHGVRLDFKKAGSIEMVSGELGAADFLWPSSQVALQLFKARHPGNQHRSEIIFNSPIVLYSWDIVTDALVRQGIVKKEGETYFITDFPRLINLIVEGKKWEEIGLPELYGRIAITTTNPTLSNSGNSFAGLLANTLHKDVVDASTVGTYLPQIKAFFARLGYLEHSSGDLFSQYLRMGVGAKPIIVGYESQIIEFSNEHADLWPKVKDRLRVLYPIPTVWSSHPIIVLKKEAEGLITALQDPELLRIGWEKHGFRTGMMDVENDPGKLQVRGIPPQIKMVIPMPSPEVMQMIIDTLEPNRPERK